MFDADRDSQIDSRLSLEDQSRYRALAEKHLRFLQQRKDREDLLSKVGLLPILTSAREGVAPVDGCQSDRVRHQPDWPSRQVSSRYALVKF